MEKLLDSLSGIERVKYLKALIEKVNNIASKHINTRLQPPKEEFQICSACAAKTKRFLLESSRNSDKIDLKRAKPISQKCDIHRLKFVRHQHNDSQITALSVPECEVRARQRQPKTEMKTSEAARDASFEAEKRCLRKIYSRKPITEVDSNQPQPKPVKNVEIKTACQDETRVDRAAFGQLHSTQVGTQENTRPALEQRRSLINTVLPQQSEPELTNSIVAERGRTLIGDSSVASRNRTVSVSNAQLSISDPLITSGSDGTRRIAGRPCAHCHRAISDVAFFDGNRQLCVECADSHFRRVTTARYQFHKPNSQHSSVAL